MKFLRFFTDDNILKTGYFDGEKVIELTDSIENILLNWKNKEYIENQMVTSYSIEDIIFAPVCKPTKIICIGLNYKDHAEELAMELPDEPKIFLKPPSSVIACDDAIVYPKMSNELDYESELAIVISRIAKDIDAKDAGKYIGGYTIMNDVTARDLQRKDEQWTRAKNFDTFAPIGPFIETDIDPINQNISLALNGEIKQSSNTKNMIFSSYELVEFISKVMTLNPGDVIATGTPSGVGSMDKGDTVEISIEDIGVLKNKVI